MADMTGPRLKLRRAHQHLKSLEARIKRFLGSNPYSLVIEADAKPGESVIRAHVHRAAPDDWGLIVGDCAHNARSALDLLVQDLSELAPDDGLRRKLQFPICLTPEKYSQAKKDKWIKEVIEVNATKIEAAQPYNRRGAQDRLEILSKIDNADKHRLIQTVAAVAWLDHVTIPIPIGDGDWVAQTNGGGVSIDGTTIGDFEPVDGGVVTKDGAVVGHLRTDLDTPVEVAAHLRIEIQFGVSDAGVDGQPVLGTLQAVLARVKEVIGQF